MDLLPHPLIVFMDFLHLVPLDVELIDFNFLLLKHLLHGFPVLHMLMQVSEELIGFVLFFVKSLHKLIVVFL